MVCQAQADGVDQRVTEAAMVPKTFVGQGRMRFVQPGGEMEPIGNRIITVPVDQTRARLRDPHAGAGFIAYVPVGSIAKGKALVETGGSGKTIACSICHGDALKGLGNVPETCGPSSDLHRAAAVSLQGRHQKWRGRAAHEKAGGEVDRRRHSGGLRVSRIAGAIGQS